jgi:hypothetical protein
LLPAFGGLLPVSRHDSKPRKIDQNGLFPVVVAPTSYPQAERPDQKIRAPQAELLVD